MATITYGNVEASSTTEIISFNYNTTTNLIDVTSMTVAVGDKRKYVEGLRTGEASIEAYGTVPATGESCTITIGLDDVFEGKVISKGKSGSVGGVETHNVTVRLEESS